jgi:hypothetical protein
MQIWQKLPEIGNADAPNWPCKFEGYVTARQEGDQEIGRFAELADEKTRHLRSTRSEEASHSRTSENLAKIPYLRGNEIELLVDGDATFGNVIDHRPPMRLGGWPSASCDADGPQI